MNKPLDLAPTVVDLFGNTLQGQRLVDTRDIFEARVSSGRWFGEHELQRIGRSGSFRCEISQVPMGTVSALRLNWGCAVRMDSHAPRHHYILAMAQAGSAAVRDGSNWHRISPDMPAIFNPLQAVELEAEEGYKPLMIRIEEQQIARAWHAIAGWHLPGPLIFEMGVASDPGLIDTWRVIWRMAAELASVPAAGQARAFTEAAFADQVSTVLLTRYRHSMSTWLSRSVPPHGAPSLLRRAEALLLQQLRGPLDLQTVCQACGTSRRSLFAVFQQERQMGPAAWLREQRLLRVRTCLQSVRANGTVRVQDIGLEFGFNHPGDLACLYRRRFGESPSETLDMARAHVGPTALNVINT